MERFNNHLAPYPPDTRRGRIYEIIFGHESKEGKQFDVVLLWAILISVFVVVLESVAELHDRFETAFLAIEWILTLLFTIELGFRIYSVKNPLAYLFSFWGVVDMVSILPAYISWIMPGTQYFTVIRILRLLRIFRILKLGQYIGVAEEMMAAMRASFYKITVFFGTVLSIVLITGALMHIIEGGENGFESIPKSIYWAIITITTVGYGDIVPHTVLGKMLASVMMITGYSILAVPTGIITVELSRAGKRNDKKCKSCQTVNTPDSNFCKNCGYRV